MPSLPVRDFEAACPHGCERLLAGELTAFGLDARASGRGRVAFAAGLDRAFEACLRSRIASRIVMPVGRFGAVSGEDLYRGATGIGWEEFLNAGTTFAVSGSGSGGGIAHSGYLALRVKDGIADRLRDRLGSRPDVCRDDPDVRIEARLEGGAVTLALDLAGAPLHRRGWRGRTGEAPLKENLAAAVLRAAGWDGRVPLLDPMCGSGTLPIEAAGIALGHAPGQLRRFSVERWANVPDELRQAFERSRQAAGAVPRPGETVAIIGSDSDRRLVDMARDNAIRAGVAGAVRFEQRDAREVVSPGVHGLIVANPPYGERMGGGDLAGLYRSLGVVWRRFSGCRLAVLCAHPGFRRAFGLRPARVFDLFNGPIPTRLYIYDLK